MKKNHDNKFKTPEGYFDSFNERLFSRMAAEEGEPNTDFLPKSDGFAVPKQYFKGVYPSVSNKLNKGETKVIALGKYRPFYYAAAAVAVIFVLTFAWNANQNQQSVLDFEDLASADIEAYLDNRDLELSTYELAEVVNLEDVSFADITEKSLEEETILEYLDENVEDLEDLDIDYEELEY